MKEYITKTLNGMAYGLFATLIIGTILGPIGTLLSSIGGNVFNYVGKAFSSVATCLQVLTGAGIGAGIALSLKKDTLKTIVLATVGEIASYFFLIFAILRQGFRSKTATFRQGADSVQETWKFESCESVFFVATT